MDIIAVKISDDTPYVLKVFNDYHVSSVPVLNDDGNVVLGFIAERVLLRSLGERLLSQNPDLPGIAEIMTQDTEIVFEDDDVFSVLELFTDHGFKTALVMNEEDHLTGIVTRRELFKTMEDFIHQEYHQKHSHRVPVKISEKYRERAKLSLAALL